MKTFFKRCYPNLEEQLSMPSFERRREEVWQQLQDWGLPVDYAYFLIHTAGHIPKGPSLVYQAGDLTIKEFLSLEQLGKWYEEEEENNGLETLEYCPIALLTTGKWLMIEVNKKAALSGAIFYNSKRSGMLQITNNLLEFLQKSTKRTPWRIKDLKQLAEQNAAEQGQIHLSDFDVYPTTKYHQEIVLVQQSKGVLEYILTRSSIVLLGDTTREYWLEELKNVSVNKIDYMQLAIKKVNQIPMQLDFGHTQEEITLYNIQEQRALKKILDFVINTSSAGYWV
ncbi:MAG: hypothetical protein AB8E82_02210 [Aureispira sp.]